MSEDNTPAPAEGDSVWVPRPGRDAFALCTVAAIKDGVYECFDAAYQKYSVPSSEVLPANPSTLDGVPDNTELMYLHDAALLHNIHYRYLKDDIYTYTAQLLIAINPYKQLPIYTQTHMDQYTAPSLAQLPPHIFAVAERAHRALKGTRRDQSILVSGESGAGKTETCKHIMRYLARAGADSAIDAAQHVLAAHPLLEAFGNAKTTRNSNSSRFGKYTEMLFDQSFKLTGTRVHAYLLETNRVTAVSPDERTFHVFYQLLAGAPAELRQQCGLPAAETATAEFALTKDGASVIKGVDDGAGYGALTAALTAVGLTETKHAQIFALLAALLHLSNVTFVERDGGVVCPAPHAAATAAGLLGLDTNELLRRLQTRTVRVHADAITVPLGAAESANARDTLARHVYGALFAWLLAVINRAADDCPPGPCIGMLDLSGFESLARNGLEQLCINAANERLQALCDACLIDREQQIYELEGLCVPRVTRPDRTALLALIEDPRSGLFAMLDEECLLPGGSAKALTRKIFSAHMAQPLLVRPRPGQHGRRLQEDEAFVVVHYAAPVLYETRHFLERNAASLPDTLCALPTSSDFVRQFLPAAPALSAGSSKIASVTAQFRQQLSALMDRLAATTCHLVRCVRPNQHQRPGVVESAEVLNQLRCSGMGVALRLLHHGYPTRVPFRSLCDRYSSLLPRELGSLPPAAFASALLAALGLHDGKDFQIGLTKVFMRSGKLAFLDALLSDSTVSASVVSAVRRWLYLRRLQRAGAAVVCANRLARRLQSMRLGALFARMVRLRLRLAHALWPLLNRARARIHNARVARKAADRAAHAKEELARAARARMEENARVDQAKHRMIVDAKLTEEIAHAALADRMAQVAETLSGFHARMQSAIAAATTAATERDRALEAAAVADTRARTAETTALAMGEKVRGLELQLRLARQAAQRESDALNEEIVQTRASLATERNQSEQARVALTAAQAEITQLQTRVTSLEESNNTLGQTLETEKTLSAQVAAALKAVETEHATLTGRLTEVTQTAQRERELLLQADEAGHRAAVLAAAQAQATAAQLDTATAENAALVKQLEASRVAAKEIQDLLDAAAARENESNNTATTLRTRISDLEAQLALLSDERTRLVNQSFSWHEAQVKLRSLYRQIRASDLLRLIYGDTSCGAMIRLGASKSGQLGVMTSERAKMAPRYCVLNDVFLLAYDKPSDSFPKMIVRMDQATATAVPGKQFTIAVSGNGHAVQLQAASEEENRTWLESLVSATQLMT